MTGHRGYLRRAKTHRYDNRISPGPAAAPAVLHESVVRINCLFVKRNNSNPVIKALSNEEGGR